MPHSMKGPGWRTPIHEERAMPNFSCPVWNGVSVEAGFVEESAQLLGLESCAFDKLQDTILPMSTFHLRAV